MSEEAYNQAQQKVLTFVLLRNYNLISDIKNIKTLSDEFTYICSCGKEKTRNFYDIKNNLKGEELTNRNYIPKCCLSIISKQDPNYKWYTDSSIDEYKDKDELWVKYQQYWVSNKGKVIGKKGENLLSSEGLIKTNKKCFTLIELMVKVFKKEDESKIPEFKDGIPHADNIIFKDNYLTYINTLKIEDFKNTESIILDGFEDYKIYSNGIIIRTASGKVKKDKFPNFEKHNNRLVIKMKDQHRYNVDILILMAYLPFFEGSEECYKTYVNELDIIHIDGDYSNCSINNLKVKHKDPSKERQRKIREEQRIRDLHEYLNSFLEKVSGELITPIIDITTIFKEFEYICKCGIAFKRTIKNIKDVNSNECSKCRSNIIKSINEEGKEYIFIKGIKYKKFDYGWISEQGSFINNNKEEIAIKKGGYVKLSGKVENARHIISRVYKIPHYEYLEKEGYYVRTKDGSSNISPNNLFIWGNGLKETIHLPQSKEFNDKLKLIEKTNNSAYFFVLSSPPLFDYKTSSLFPGISVYKDGVIRMSEDTYTIGRIKPSGYCDISIKGKTYYVHRIVCFLFNPIEGKITFDDYKELAVNHIDGNKRNNSAKNLEWVTNSENSKHAIDNLLTGYTYPVRQYSLKDGKRGELIKEYSCIRYAIDATGQCREHITKVCLGEAKGYKYDWEFVKKESIEKAKQPKRIKLTVDSKQQDDIIIEEDIDIPVPK